MKKCKGSPLPLRGFRRLLRESLYPLRGSLVQLRGHLLGTLEDTRCAMGAKGGPLCLEVYPLVILGFLLILMGSPLTLASEGDPWFPEGVPLVVTRMSKYIHTCVICDM